MSKKSSLTSSLRRVIVGETLNIYELFRLIIILLSLGLVYISGFMSFIGLEFSSLVPRDTMIQLLTIITLYSIIISVLTMFLIQSLDMIFGVIKRGANASFKCIIYVYDFFDRILTKRSHRFGYKIYRKLNVILNYHNNTWLNYIVIITDYFIGFLYRMIFLIVLAVPLGFALRLFLGGYNSLALIFSAIPIGVMVVLLGMGG